MNNPILEHVSHAAFLLSMLVWEIMSGWPTMQVLCLDHSVWVVCQAVSPTIRVWEPTISDILGWLRVPLEHSKRSASSHHPLRGDGTCLAMLAHGILWMAGYEKSRRHPSSASDPVVRKTVCSSNITKHGTVLPSNLTQVNTAQDYESYLENFSDCCILVRWGNCKRKPGSALKCILAQH